MRLVRSGGAALALIATVGALPGTAPAQEFQTEKHKVRVVTIAKGLSHPWGMVFLPDGRMLVTERPGRMRLVGSDGRISPPIAGVPEVYARGQGGLLDVTLHPGFAGNRLVYFTYAEPGPGGAGTAAAFARLSDDGTRLENPKVIFRQEPKAEGGQHFGSRIVFASDGRIFITLGERGQMETAQVLSVNRGQVIRLEADGCVPADNPFVGRNGARFAAQQPHQRHPDRLRQGVPEGHIDAGEHHPRKTLQAEQTEMPLQLLLDGERRERMTPDDLLKIREKLDHRLQGKGRIAEDIATAGDPFLALKVYQDQWRRAHQTAAGLQRPLHRHVHRARPQAPNGQLLWRDHSIHLAIPLVLMHLLHCFAFSLSGILSLSLAEGGYG
jgi:hypothetical protein